MSETQQRTEVVPIENIRAPGRNEKLHPVEKEDDETWRRFKKSVGTSPRYPIVVTENGDGQYIVIDGDRRLRAMKENGATHADVIVRQIADPIERSVEMINLNEEREENDPVQRSWHTAKCVAPWLLPPGEREDNGSGISQDEFGDKVDVSGTSVNNWLKPMRNQNPIRDMLGSSRSPKLISSTRPNEQDLELIDEIVGMLNGELGDSRIIPTNQTSYVANEVRSAGTDLSISLIEFHRVVEKASSEGWSHDELIDYLKDHFVVLDEESSESGSTVESGGPGLQNDTSEKETNDGDPDRVSDPPDTENDQEQETEPTVEVDWSEVVTDDDLPDDHSLRTLEHNVMKSVTLEDDVAVGVGILEAITDTDTSELFNGPILGEVIIETVKAELDERGARASEPPTVQ